MIYQNDKTMSQQRTHKSKVMNAAWVLHYRDGLPFSEALSLSIGKVKSISNDTTVHVEHGKDGFNIVETQYTYRVDTTWDAEIPVTNRRYDFEPYRYDT